ncbi:MAG: hypothetical protein GY727_02060, partial [Gammaproteobacteria bacterium]|nr:hypothetical protein [Gammaproteobacteria bacterium]
LLLGLLCLVAGSVAQADGSTATYFVHTDHLGTPQVMTDIYQDIVWKADYNPFGKATVTTELVENNVRFPGQYFDSETGLHYNYFRYYETGTGRYITSDPIGLQGGLNTYGYVSGNPMYWSDPLGLWSEEAHNHLISLFGNNNKGLTQAQRQAMFGNNNGLTQAQMQAMMHGSAFADSWTGGFQGPDYSYMHAMSSETLSKAEACKLANQFINQNLGAYNDLLSGAMPTNALTDNGWNLPNTLHNPYFLLGVAMHIVMDSTSPAHQNLGPGMVIKIPIG